MKKILRLLPAFFAISLSFSSCYEDKGNYDYTLLPKIEITAQESVYATQFTTLELPVEIEYLDNAKESDYDFSWRIWKNDAVGTYNQTKDICLTKDLKYEVTEIPGTYTLTLTCHNRKTEVDAYKSIQLVVQGIITEGWMVLHEKDGQTDFDYIMSPYFSNRVTEDQILHNVYESVNHEKLPGRGVRIGSFFCIGRYQETIVITDEGGARLDAATMLKNYDMTTLTKYMHSYKPENYLFYHYWYSPGRLGFDAIISDGKFYMRSGIRAEEYNFYTEPILRDGITYHASPHAPRYICYCNGIIYDETSERLLRVTQSYEDPWILIETPDEFFSGTHFLQRDVKGTLRFMEAGFRNHEYGLFMDEKTKKHTLLAFDFTEYKNIDQGKYDASSCKELAEAQYFEIGDLGPIFYYATDRDIYLYDYEGSKTSRIVYTLANSNEKITGMKLLKPCLDRFVVSHPYNCKVLFLSTYNESTKEGKLYMYYVNVSNGVIDTSSEKVIGGFGEILDMEYNYPKYGS